MTTLSVARHALLGFGILWLVAVGIGSLLAISHSRLPFAEFVYATALVAGLGLSLSAMACLLLQLAPFIRKHFGIRPRA